jgi:hypothetical protein
MPPRAQRTMKIAVSANHWGCVHFRGSAVERGAGILPANRYQNSKSLRAGRLRRQHFSIAAARGSYAVKIGSPKVFRAASIGFGFLLGAGRFKTGPSRRPPHARTVGKPEWISISRLLRPENSNPNSMNTRTCLAGRQERVQSHVRFAASPITIKDQGPPKTTKP